MFLFSMCFKFLGFRLPCASLGFNVASIPVRSMRKMRRKMTKADRLRIKQRFARRQANRSDKKARKEIPRKWYNHGFVLEDSELIPWRSTTAVWNRKMVRRTVGRVARTSKTARRSRGRFAIIFWLVGKAVVRAPSPKAPQKHEEVQL